MLINVIERIEGEKKENSKSYKIQTGQQHLKAYNIIFEKHQVPSLLDLKTLGHQSHNPTLLFKICTKIKNSWLYKDGIQKATFIKPGFLLKQRGKISICSRNVKIS